MQCLEKLLHSLHLVLTVGFSIFYDVETSNTCGVGPKICKPSIVRSYDGSCNNLNHPKWGSVHSEYDRMLPPKYGDGISSFPTSTSGKPLPSARLLSKRLFSDKPIEDSRFTMLAMQYGQFVAHDISYTTITNSELGCCSPDFQFLDPAKTSPSCAAIEIPTDDPDYSPFKAVCMSFNMTDTNQMHRCDLDKKHSEKINDVSSFLDLNVIYGTSEKSNRILRSFKDGQFIVIDKHGEEYYKPATKPSRECSAENLAQCFDVNGDHRINQNPQLAILHIVFLREHNRLARQLRQLNPHWDDEKVFQEARKINIAQHQFIAYYELLSVYMGQNSLLQKKLIHFSKGYVADYDESVNPAAYNEFSQAAFRHFHSMIWAKLFLFSEQRQFQGSIDLVDNLRNPEILLNTEKFEQLSRGLITQATFASDENYDPGITKFLFKQRHMEIGLDLKATDIQRSRNHGLPSYNDMRQVCGLKGVANFEELNNEFDEKTINGFKDLYENVNDIDLSVGGSLEKFVTEALVGPTFLCILTKQFKRLRSGDRFFFENDGKHFTPNQLNEIRKTSVSKVLCNNIKNMKSAQPRGFQTISKENTLTPCTDLPGIDLSKWKE